MVISPQELRPTVPDDGVSRPQLQTPTSMRPDPSKIRLHDNERQIEKLLMDLVIRPRIELIKWSKITKQTPNVKIGYPGQHLASLITGVEGSRTGARGHDLSDGTEVKSCSRIDQLDKCKTCGAAVARLEIACPECEGADIKRNDDSKWLFGIRSEAELHTLTVDVDRVLLMIGDHPDFDAGDFSTLRFQAFEIWPKNPRHRHFVTLMDNYYRKIYLPKRATGTPAPKNFWPYSYQFYMCNPIQTFSCIVTSADTHPEITVQYVLDPTADREPLASLTMPASVARKEIDALVDELPDEQLQRIAPSVSPSALRRMNRVQKVESIIGIDEDARELLSLRDTDVPVTQAAYRRRRL